MDITNPILLQEISALKDASHHISEERKQLLQELIEYVVGALQQEKEVHLNFICTHNSRRSQFSQIWAQTAAHYYNIPVQCHSGGVEVTAFNHRAVESLRRSGFDIRHEPKHEDNPLYHVYFHESGYLKMFSKLYNDPVNEATRFAAVMTCSEADDQCPVIPGAAVRIPLTYEDPKQFDGTPEESERYDERSRQIGGEMLYVFQKVSEQTIQLY